jgi:hypothetical protein
MLQFSQFKQPTMSRLEMTYAEITAAHLSASQARAAICDLADQFSWETVAREMLSRMTGDEAREFVEDFQSLYAD